MNPIATRRFTLLDALVLIAALAVGLASTRSVFGNVDFVEYLRRDLLSWPAGGWTLKELYGRGFVVDCLLAPWLVSLSLAHCILYLIPPRPPWRRTRRRVGFLTSSIVVFVAATLAISLVTCWWASRKPGVPYMEELIAMWGVTMAPAVSAFWLALALSGRWRAERSWLDRLGRVLGWIWISFLPLGGMPAVLR